MAEATAKQIAESLVHLCRKSGRTDTTNLKLQKLLYYSQAWHLVLRKAPLFDEPIEAWVHGPVVPAVFHEFKQYRWNTIDCNVEPIQSTQTIEFLGRVIDRYAPLTATDLERLTHREKPWRDARGSLPSDAPSRAVISHEAMREFYSTFLRQ